MTISESYRRGALALALLLAAGAALAQTGRLEPGDDQLGSGEYIDVYSHPGRAGDTVRIGLASGDFDAYLIVLDPTGAELVQVDDSPGFGLDVQVELALPADGAYSVAVTSARPGETGAYTLTLEDLPAGRSAAPLGSFSDGALTVELWSAAGELQGRLHLGGRSYELVATRAGATLQGSFAADGQSFPFRAELAGDVLTLESGGARYTLQRRTTEPNAGVGTPAPVPAPTPAPAPTPSPAGPTGSAPAAPGATTRFFFLPIDAEGAHNSGRPRIAVDAGGGIHMALPGYAGGDAYYLHCPAECHDPAQLATVTIPTEGTATNAMIALDAAGVPQLLIGAAGEVVYATCTGDCRQPAAWTHTTIVRHAADADREVTGAAFALDPLGRPRFVMHAYRALFGIGQPDPVTLYVACDADCQRPENWRQSRMSEQIWQESTLRFGGDGRAHLATVASSDAGDIGGYLTCAHGCESGRDDAWTGLGLTWSFSDRTIERIDPAISLALTRDGRPRVLLLGRNDAGTRDLSFWACDAADCTVAANWRSNWLIDGDQLSAGLDLTLDPEDRPRAVYNADDNIFLLACDGDCLADDDGGWTLLPVELAGSIPADTVIPYANCTIAAWLLRYPSLALGPDGLPRVAYLAEDLSGALGPQDPRYPRCTPGVDMAIGRFSLPASLRPPP